MRVGEREYIYPSTKNSKEEDTKRDGYENGVVYDSWDTIPPVSSGATFPFPSTRCKDFWEDTTTSALHSILSHVGVVQVN